MPDSAAVKPAADRRRQPLRTTEHATAKWADTAALGLSL